MLDGVVWTERDISTRSPIWSVGTGRLMTGASVDCLPSAGRLLVFCDSCAVVVVDGPESGGMVRTGLGISIRFAIWSVGLGCTVVGGSMPGVCRAGGLPEFSGSWMIGIVGGKAPGVVIVPRIRNRRVIPELVH